jgi:hypothetical protein
VSTKVRREGDSRTETKEDAQAIHGHVDNGDRELLDEGSGEEVEQREQPPYTHEESVVDDGVCAVSRTCDVVASHGCHDDGADELSGVSDGPCLYVVGDGIHTCQARRPMDRTLDTILILDVVDEEVMR